MGRFAKQLSALLVVVLLLETVNASNLKWVAASNGNVPAYPVVGGENFSGEVLYVARIKLDYGLSPGKMAPSDKVAKTTYGEKEISNSNYEILTNPGWATKLEWIKNSGNVAPYDAVLGGREGGAPLFVARLMYKDGHMIPGKAPYHYFYKVAYAGYDNKVFQSAEWYVLREPGTATF